MTFAASAFTLGQVAGLTAEDLLAYDPDDVRPGGIALFVVVVLGVATFLLWRSMNTQLRKIQMPPKGSSPAADSSGPESPPGAGGNGSPEDPRSNRDPPNGPLEGGP